VAAEDVKEAIGINFFPKMGLLQQIFGQPGVRFA